MHIRRRDTLIEIHTPAKVNLFLEVHRRRADGFHEVETLISPLELCDSLRVAKRLDDRLQVTCRWSTGRQAAAASHNSPDSQVWSDLPQGEGNLVVRALQRLRDRAEIIAGADVEIIKRIPAAAGLGGASSDAAAALVAANAVWKLAWSKEKLSDVAAEIGSDVPFFLTDGSAVCRGRGECIERVETRTPLWMVVVRPPVGLSTAAVYRGCRPAVLEEVQGDDERSVATDRSNANGTSSIRPIDRLLAALRSGDSAEVGKQMFNRLQPAAELLSPWIGQLRNVFDRVDCLGHQMSGSGSSYFGICRHARHARRVAGYLRSAGLGAVFVTATLGAGTSPRAIQFKEERHGNHRGSHQAHGEL